MLPTIAIGILAAFVSGVVVALGFLGLLNITDRLITRFNHQGPL